MNHIDINTFMDACRDFEAAVKLQYQLEDSASCYMFVAGLSKFAPYRDELHVIRTLRNMLAHNNMEIDGEEIIHFSPLLLSTLKKITNLISKPILVKDCMVKNMFSASFDDKVSYLIKNMKEKGISHIPVFDENNTLLGVFSQSTLFSYSSEEGVHNLSENDKVSLFAKYLPIDMHDNEAFGFIGCEEDVEKAKSLFKRTKANKKRIVMLFVSKDGLSSQRILGILTPWDVIE